MLFSDCGENVQIADGRVADAVVDGIGVAFQFIVRHVGELLIAHHRGNRGGNALDLLDTAAGEQRFQRLRQGRRLRQLAQGAGTSAALTQIAAERDAHVKLVQVQLLTPASRRWNGVAIRCATGARVEVVRIELGAGIVVAGARAALASRGGEFDLDAVYYGGGDAVLDFNDVSVHTARDTTSELHTAGVLADRAQKVLRGTIDFRRGAVRGVGHESEDVLLFSPAVRNRTTPLILCTEEQVEGQHAATIGRLDEGMLYYLASRGLDPEEAKRLMVDARFAPAIDKLPDDALQAAVRAEIGRRLDHHA